MWNLVGRICPIGVGDRDDVVLCRADPATDPVEKQRTSATVRLDFRTVPSDSLPPPESACLQARALRKLVDPANATASELSQKAPGQAVSSVA